MFRTRRKIQPPRLPPCFQILFPTGSGDGGPIIYWANAVGVFSWMDAAAPSTVSTVYSASLFEDGVGALKSFAGGRSPGGELTLAAVNSNGTACTGGDWETFHWNSDGKRATHLAHCGHVLLRRGDEAPGAWIVQGQAFGAFHVYMAANDGNRVYTTGAREWDGGTGTRVRLATRPSDRGDQFEFATVFLQVDVVCMPGRLEPHAGADPRLART